MRQSRVFFKTPLHDSNSKSLSLLFMIVFFLLSSFASLSGQNNCPDFGASPEFEQGLPPLCQRYHSGTYPNIWGGLGKQKSSQIIALNGGNNVFTGNIELIADFEVDAPFILLGCKMNIAPNIKIKVNDITSFTLDGSKLFACIGMWSGIKLGHRSTIISQNITEIEDAQAAIEATCGNQGMLFITQTIFNRNYVGIKLNQNSNSTICSTAASIFFEFSGNRFDCTSPLNGTVSDVTYAGIQLYKGGGSIGASNNVEANLFQRIQFGIRFENQLAWGSTAIEKCNFERILLDGIYCEKGQLRINNCNFTNCARTGIYALLSHGLTVQNCVFSLDDNVKEITIFPTPWDLFYQEKTHMGIHVRGFAVGAPIIIHENQFDVQFLDEINFEEAFCINLWISFPGEAGAAHFTIEDNVIHMIMTAPNPNTSDYYECAGIAINALQVAGASALIQYNNFYINQTKAYVNSFGDHLLSYTFGIKGTHINRTTLYQNTFNSSGPSYTGDRAIQLEGGATNLYAGNNVKYNVIYDDPDHENSGNFFHGIVSHDMNNVNYCSNTLRESSILMHLNGNSSGTKLFKNYFEVGQAGLYVENGFIGEQGVEEGEHNQNHWYDEPGSTTVSNEHAFSTAQYAPLSRIWSHDPQSIYSNPNNPNPPLYQYQTDYYPAKVNPGNEAWFRYDPDGFITSVTCDGMYNESDFTDRSIADGSIQSYVQDPYLIWTSKRYLYSKLKANPGLIDDYSAFSTFLTQEQSTSIGKLYNVYNKIDSAQQVSSIMSTHLLVLHNNWDSIFQLLSNVDNLLHSATQDNEMASAKSAKIQLCQNLDSIDTQYATLYTEYTTNFLIKLQEALQANNLVSPVNDFD